MAADDTRFAIVALFYVLSNLMEKVPQEKKVLNWSWNPLSFVKTEGPFCVHKGLYPTYILSHINKIFIYCTIT